MGNAKAGAEPCCPELEPLMWEEKTHQWHDKLFIKDTVPQVFHIPLPGTMNKTMMRMWKKAEQAGAAPEMRDFLMLAYDPSPWRSEFYLAVTKAVPGAENVKLTGTFISKVFDGPFQDVPKWIGQMDAEMQARGKKVIKYYFYYTTCPRCARIYGHNYVVAFGQVE